MCDATHCEDSDSRKSWETTPPHLTRSDLEPPSPNNLMDLVIYRLKQRNIKSAGVVSLADGSSAYVFACKGKVCTVVNFNRDRDEIMQAFTTNSVSKSDNFDRNITATITETATSFQLAGLDNERKEEEGYPLENGVFGAGKILTALYSIKELLFFHGDGWNETSVDVLGVIFDSCSQKSPVGQNPEFFWSQCWYAAFRGSRAISVQLGMHLMKKNLLSICDSVIKLATDNHDKIAREIAEKGFSKTESLDNDPVVLKCIANGRFLRAWGAVNRDSKDAGMWAEMFFKSMGDILDVIHLAHPTVAKMGVGRAVIFPCIKTPWEIYSAPMVAFARRAMLCADPVQLYMFGLSSWYGKSEEFSTSDDIWAHRIKPSKGEKGPLDVFLPEMVLDKGLDGKREDIIELMRGKEKLLGAANAMALKSIKREVTGMGSRGLTLADPEIIAYLKKIGWEEWFNCKMLSSSPFGVFDCVEKIDPEIAYMLRTTTKGDVKAFFDSLNEELA